jgi:hypothetical protein
VFLNLLDFQVGRLSFASHVLLLCGTLYEKVNDCFALFLFDCTVFLLLFHCTDVGKSIFAHKWRDFRRPYESVVACCCSHAVAAKVEPAVVVAAIVVVGAKATCFERTILFTKYIRACACMIMFAQMKQSVGITF